MFKKNVDNCYNIVMKKKLLFLTLIFVSAFLLSTGFDNQFFWWFSLFGLVPLLVFVDRVKTKKAAFWGGWLVGFLFFARNLHWFLAAQPSWWTGVRDAETIFVGFFVVWFGSALVLGLSFGVFALVSFLWRKRNHCFSALFLSSVWILLEYLRAWFFSFWSWGPESIFGPYWTFGHIGYALINSSASVLARYGGLYGLSFLVVFFNILVFNLSRLNLDRFRTKVRPWSLIKVGPFFVFLFLVFVFIPFMAGDYSSEKVIRADVLQTNTLPFFYYRGLTEHLEKNPLPENTSDLIRLVVFPEGSNFFSIMTQEAEEVLPHLFSKKEKGMIISGALFKEGGLNYEKVIYRDETGRLLSMQKKSFLIPAGEYLPYLVEIAFKFFGFDEHIAVFNSNRLLRHSDIRETAVDFGGVKVGTLLCSGVLSPVFYRDLTEQGAEILINPSSHAIFGSSKQALSQMEMFVRFQAIANARSFLQSANGDYSFIVDANGDFVKRSHELNNSFISGEAPVVSKKTLYTKLGDWPLWLALGFVLFYFYLRLRYNKKDGKKNEQ